MKKREFKEKFERDFALLSPDSDVMEAFRMIRTNIEFSSKSTVRTVLLTSSVPNEGKSTTISNLARAFAHSGYRTLIVDLDMRRPVQHKIFGVPNNIGVTSLIVKQCKASEAIQATMEENLYLLPCGIRPKNPAELLRSVSSENLIKFLGSKFDIVFIDSPPAMAIADAAIISAYVDTTILIVSANNVDYRCVQHTISNLTKVNANMMGCIINDIKDQDSSYYKYKGKYYANY
ncbi:MAG: CpsD/CapB family tyrosine-protein kinase [Oscillospiraceae bacterium]|jgi:capsular exopolysaccharide synthesis family protein|nr:CpsD/CapB family tyrosine-protein kinase [Oscillospiraceae bacterium]